LAIIASAMGASGAVNAAPLAGVSAISAQDASLVEQVAVRRAVVVRPRGAVVVRRGVVRPRTVIVRPVRPWARRAYYGTIIGGVALGTIIAATAIPAAPAPELCWYWANSAHTRGYWDYCVPR
jgi:hypothetical protein